MTDLSSSEEMGGVESGERTFWNNKFYELYSIILFLPLKFDSIIFSPGDWSLSLNSGLYL